MGKGGCDLGLPRLKGSSNWKQWERGMEYNLQSKKLWEYVDEDVPCPRAIVLDEKDQDDDIKISRQEKRDDRIRNWHSIRLECVGTILSWVREDIAIDLEAKKALQSNLDLEGNIVNIDYQGKWTLKKLWICLEARFTEQSSSKAWSA